MVEKRNGFNCLHAACDGGYADVVKYLIEKQHMDPYQTVKNSKSSCLHLAATKGRALVVQYLSQMKKMKEIMVSGDDNSLTPLHLYSSTEQS